MKDSPFVHESSSSNRVPELIQNMHRVFIEYQNQFPNAVLVVHPRGARHMIDPEKLIAGTVEVLVKKTHRNIMEPSFQFRKIVY